MRFLDIGVAVMIGVSALAGVAVWTPRSADNAAAQMAIRAQLRDRLLAFLESRGLPWVMGASPTELCSALSAELNGTAKASATIAADSCGDPPPRGSVSSNLTLRFLPFEVTLVAWSGV